MSRVLFGCLLLVVCVNFSREAKAELIAGKKVERDAKIQVGAKFVAHFEKKNYLVEVKELRRNNKLKIVWVETKEETDDISPEELYYIGDANQGRKSKTTVLPDAYRKFDKNGDGQIALSEWDRARYSEFMKLDKNHDGFLTPQELATKPSGLPNAVVAAKEGENNPPKDAKDLTYTGNLDDYRDKVGETFTFTVTGKSEGNIWGIGPYAIDSDLGVAAVHASVLKAGVTGPVKVTIVKPVEKFMGSTSNDITSLELTEMSAAYTLK